MMDWFSSIDSYCERIGPHLFAEPINLITNAAFIFVAFFMWRRSYGNHVAQILTYILAIIGIGSALLHSFAQPWAAFVDVAAILVFVLYYIYLANRVFRENSVWVSIIGVGLFFPYAWLVTFIFAQFRWINSSAGYMSIALLLALYAVDLKKRKAKVALGLCVGSIMLLISIGFRSLDLQVCPSMPIGTHFLWHLINALMLGWMIEVYRRHETEKKRALKTE